MGQSTFSGPVRSLNGFLGTGPNMVQAITGTVADSKTNINKYQGKVLTIGDAATVFNLPDINSTTTQDDPTTANNVGMIYEFVVTASLTGANTFVLNAGASAGHALADVFRGMAIYNNTATDPGAVTAFSAGGTDTLTLTATTKGGLEGAHIKCRAVAGLIWQIEAQLIGNGAFAQPWS
tara:strand:- start:7 stop:543 length:537 start_codon:yes stop_codon:yes gene_type:complete